MPENESPQAGRPLTNGITFERHFQTAIQGIIILILMWYGNKTIATSDTVIRLEEQMLALRSEFKTMTNNRFTAPEAKALHSIIDHQIDSIKKRVEDLEDGN
jgi:hypothetical protein